MIKMQETLGNHQMKGAVEAKGWLFLRLVHYLLLHQALS
jgi:hypothetical protein